MAITCGYIFGKISYRKICEEKFISNSNSPLGDMLRKKRYGGANRYCIVQFIMKCLET